MTKSELLRDIASTTGISQTDVDLILSDFTRVVEVTLRRGDEVTYPGLGKFIPQHKPARTAHNPRTGAQVQVPAKTVPKFRPAKALTESLN